MAFLEDAAYHPPDSFLTCSGKSRSGRLRQWTQSSRHSSRTGAPIEVVRTALVTAHPTDFGALALSGMTGAVLVVLGWQTFARLEVKMADVV